MASEAGSFLTMLPGVVLHGLYHFTDPPRTMGLKLVHVPTPRKENFVRPLGNHSPINPKLTRRLDPVKEIWFLAEAWGMQQQCRVSVNLITRRIDWDRTDRWLFGHEHKGAGMIGVALFSAIPALVLSGPIAAANGYFRLREASHRMSRHSIDIFNKLAPQLHPEIATLLKEALQNTWAHEQERSRRVNLEEAQAYLRGCDLHVVIMEDDDVEADEEHGETSRTYREPSDGSPRKLFSSVYWMKSGNNRDPVAQGVLYKDDPECNDIHVLGSRFTGEEAAMLRECYQTIHERMDLDND